MVQGGACPGTCRACTCRALYSIDNAPWGPYHGTVGVSEGPTGGIRGSQRGIRGSQRGLPTVVRVSQQWYGVSQQWYGTTHQMFGTGPPTRCLVRDHPFYGFYSKMGQNPSFYGFYSKNGQNPSFGPSQKEDKIPPLGLAKRGQNPSFPGAKMVKSLISGCQNG